MPPFPGRWAVGYRRLRTLRKGLGREAPLKRGGLVAAIDSGESLGGPPCPFAEVKKVCLSCPGFNPLFGGTYQT